MCVCVCGVCVWGGAGIIVHCPSLLGIRELLVVDCY